MHYPSALKNDTILELCYAVFASLRVYLHSLDYRILINYNRKLTLFHRIVGGLALLRGHYNNFQFSSRCGGYTHHLSSIDFLDVSQRVSHS